MISHPNRTRRKTATPIVTTTPTSDPIYSDAAYDQFLGYVQAQLDISLQDPTARLFTTDTVDLFSTYLAAFPQEYRQYHNCNTCRRFINTYGGLVTIDSTGRTEPVMWPGAGSSHNPYVLAGRDMRQRVQRGVVTGVFLSSTAQLGERFNPKKDARDPSAALWLHVTARLPNRLLHTSSHLTAGQAMAVKRENYTLLQRAVQTYPLADLLAAMHLMDSEHLTRAERFVGPLKFLIGLHTARSAVQNRRHQTNLLWRAAATAPDSHCHPQSGVLGALLDDIAATLPFLEIQRKWSAKLHPLRYQRPQAAPAAGAIAAAEKLVETLGIARSLERRFARLEDVQTIWTPVSAPQSAAAGRTANAGVFSHLTPKDSAAAHQTVVTTPPTPMTWVKFAATVMPNATDMALNVPAVDPRFIGLTTATYSDAPPILKWDTPDWRYPVAWYHYVAPTMADDWNLIPGWVRVTAITPLPPLCAVPPMPYLGEGAVLLLEGARDTRNKFNALFPECLRDELHEVRSVIEAYSRTAQLSGEEDATACGFHIRKRAAEDWKQQRPVVLRVMALSGLTQTYHIDRWD